MKKDISFAALEADSSCLLGHCIGKSATGSMCKKREGNPSNIHFQDLQKIV